MEPYEATKKSFDLGGNRTHDHRIRSTVTLPTELGGRTENVGCDLGGESRRRESKGTYECCGFVSHRGQKIFSLPGSCGSMIPFTRANAQWVIHGFN